MRNHNVPGTVCQRREATALAPQSEFLRELHRRWTASGLLREIDVALAHLDDFAEDAAIEAAMGTAASEDARLGLKLVKLLTKRRRNALLLDEAPPPEHGRGGGAQARYGRRSWRGQTRCMRPLQ
jgi:hypothetical protein